MAGMSAALGIRPEDMAAVYDAGLAISGDSAAVSQSESSELETQSATLEYYQAQALLIERSDNYIATLEPSQQEAARGVVDGIMAPIYEELEASQQQISSDELTQRMADKLQASGIQIPHPEALTAPASEEEINTALAVEAPYMLQTLVEELQTTLASLGIQSETLDEIMEQVEEMARHASSAIEEGMGHIGDMASNMLTGHDGEDGHGDHDDDHGAQGEEVADGRSPDDDLIVGDAGIDAGEMHGNASNAYLDEIAEGEALGAALAEQRAAVVAEREASPTEEELLAEKIMVIEDHKKEQAEAEAIAAAVAEGGIFGGFAEQIRQARGGGETTPEGQFAPSVGHAANQRAEAVAGMLRH